MERRRIDQGGTETHLLLVSREYQGVTFSAGYTQVSTGGGPMRPAVVTVCGVEVGLGDRDHGALWLYDRGLPLLYGFAMIDEITALHSSPLLN